MNTRSSTESELVGVDDCMSSILWTRHFLEAQGYKVKENIVYQDNQSAILLEKNGKASSGKRTKHIHVRYFFVTDRINNGEISVEWCPTEDMTGDFMTKPNQGATFKKFRDQLMGVVKATGPSKRAPKIDNTKADKGTVMAVHHKKRDSSPQECVRVKDNRIGRKAKISKLVKRLEVLQIQLEKYCREG